MERAKCVPTLVPMLLPCHIHFLLRRDPEKYDDYLTKKQRDAKRHNDVKTERSGKQGGKENQD